ncbi:hypothetical protein [Olivibacter domesticus]|uniref:Uncharacterized protein n=1 Tax=Olivibacter domesticus TaxID=407022 RepID=A0A1H7IKK8_OLID1|nr:hypothetical protein [Olivibacter domesticus]SEK62257.1 hypothetical protein SAMN05661044_00716 [Olivibacter domesticus]
MKYFILLLPFLAACSKFELPTAASVDPMVTSEYRSPDFGTEQDRITGLIGNQKYKVVSVVDERTGAAADSLYPGFIGNIYVIGAKRNDSIKIMIGNKSTIPLMMEGWNLGVDVGNVGADGSLKVTEFRFPVYDPLRKEYSMKIFYIDSKLEDYRISWDTIILKDRLPQATILITLKHIE